MLLFGFQSPKRFEEVFEEMISFLEHTEHWENTELELAARGVSVILWPVIQHNLNRSNSVFPFFSLLDILHQVKQLNFYDIVLDFILMDSFEDLENPPISIQNVINNRWLNSSFKETVSKTTK